MGVTTTWTLSATGGSGDIPEVETVDDLYEFWTRAAVQEAIRDDLGFTDVRDFVAMMQIKVRIDGEWREVNRLLDIAGRRRRGVPTFTVDERPGFDPSDFDALVNYYSSYRFGDPGAR